MSKKRKAGRPPGSSALYRKVAANLTLRLAANEWAPGEALPSLRDIAKHYKVGFQVARLAVQVLKTAERVSVNPRHKIIALSQSDIVSATGNLIAMVLNTRLDLFLENPDNKQLYLGMAAAAGRDSNPLLIVHHGIALRSVIPPDLLDLPLRGILLNGHFHKTTLKAYAKLSVPAVLVDQPSSIPGLSSVCVDNETAAYDVTRRLLDLGHRRVAFFRFVHTTVSDIDPDSKEREKGYRRAMKERGLKRNKQHAISMLPTTRTRKTTLRSFFLSKPPFTAVVSADADRAKEIDGMATDFGRAVPSNLSVACFQGTHALNRKWTGPAIDFFEIGMESVRVLGEAQTVGQPVIRRLKTNWNSGSTIRKRR